MNKDISVRVYAYIHTYINYKHKFIAFYNVIFIYNENSCKNENNEEVEKYMGNIYKILNQTAQEKI